MTINNINDLPVEIVKYEILQQADIPTLEVLRSVSKKWKKLAEDDFIWKRVNEQLEFLFPKESAELRSQIKKHTLANKSKIMWLDDTPKYILTLLCQKQKIYNIKWLTKWLDVKDNLISYVALSTILNLRFSPLEKITKVEEAVALENMLPLWREQQKNALLSFSTFKLKRKGLLLIPTLVQSLINLRTLDLKENYIAEIPKPITEFKQLKHLILSDNHLSTIPQEICKLNNNLRELDLNGNKFTEFPTPLLTLTRLNKLYMERNSISTVPDEIDQMISLRFFSIIDNKVTKPPNTLANLRHLEGGFHF